MNLNFDSEERTAGLLRDDPTSLVSLVTSCARAYISAFYLSLKAGFIGAEKNTLNVELQEAGMSAGDWSIFEAAWKNRTNGAMNIETDNGVVKIFRRSQPDLEHIVIRPNVYEIVEHILGDTMPENLLIDLYKADLCRHYNIEDSPEFTDFSYEWIVRFNNVKLNSDSTEQNFSQQSHEGYLSLLTKFIGATEAKQLKLKLWAQGLVEFLEYTGVLIFNPENIQGHKVQFRADPNSIYGNLLGRSTGVEGLDVLFFGGLYVPGRDFNELNVGPARLSTVISGAAGMGKSTLALGMGIQVAARGGLCRLYHFELDNITILHQITQFYRHLLPFFSIESTEGQNLHEPLVTPRKLGKIVIAKLSPNPVDKIEDLVLQSAMENWNSPEFAERIVILDSISAIKHYGAPQTKWRHKIFNMFSSLRGMGFSVVSIVERDGSVKSENSEDFIADVAIRLVNEELSPFPHSFRALEVTKSRLQASHRGMHMFSIASDRGMKVFPSSAATINLHRRREARIRYAKMKSIYPGVKWSAKYLGHNDTERKLEANDAVSWWKEGSITALIGRRGTLKSSFGESFSNALEVEDGYPSCGLTLHLGDEFPLNLVGFHREDQRSASFGVRYDRILENGCVQSYLLFRSGYFTPGYVLDIVRNIVSEKRKALIPVRRAVISDAGNIAADFPGLKRDPLFLPALCNVLAAEGITTLLIYSLAEHGDVDYVVDQIRSVAENIIHVDHISYGGQTYTTINVERSDDSSHDPFIYELKPIEPDTNANSPKTLEVIPTFDLVLDLKDKPKAAKVNISLFAETDLQVNYHRSVANLHKELGAYAVEIRGHSPGFAQQSVARHIRSAERALWISQIDAFKYVDDTKDCSSTEAAPRSSASHDSNHEMPFIDMALIDPDIRDLRQRLVGFRSGSGSNSVEGTDAQSLRHNFTTAQILTLPYYLNPSFIAVRKGLLSFVKDKQEWEKISVGEGDYSWDALIAAAKAYGKFHEDENPADKPLNLFACPMNTTENLNCLFLEIWESLLNASDINKPQSSINGKDCFSCFDPRTEMGYLAVKAAIILKTLLHDWINAKRREMKSIDSAMLEYSTSDSIANANYSKLFGSVNTSERAMGEKESSNIPRVKVDSNAIIWRHWYSTFRQMAADMSDGDHRNNPNLALIRLPKRIWSNGDWHLAIQQESVGAREGIKILTAEFVTESAALARMMQGVGLPPFREFYANLTPESPVLPVSCVPLGWFKSYIDDERVIHRSTIQHYNEISTVLNTYLFSILTIDPDPAVDNLHSLVAERLHSMHQVIQKYRHILKKY